MGTVAVGGFGRSADDDWWDSTEVTGGLDAVLILPVGGLNPPVYSEAEGKPSDVSQSLQVLLPWSPRKSS